MANRRASGGLIGKTNKTSGGGNTVTRFNSSGTFQVQPNTNIVDVLTVAGGGGGGGSLVGPGPLVPGIPAMDAGAAGGGVSVAGENGGVNSSNNTSSVSSIANLGPDNRFMPISENGCDILEKIQRPMFVLEKHITVI